jgi:glyoxylase-like metal-dependent hydrolase (beta-lactamase superfamily II)
MFFSQLRNRGDNFSYVIADEVSREAAVADPSFNANAIIELLRNHDMKIKYVINTHNHIDHTAGNEEIRSILGAKIVAHKLSKLDKDIIVVDGDVIEVGKISIKVIHTPGHSPDGICLLVDGKLLTGDTLFVGECGRTDLHGGKPEELYHSLFNKLLKLDENVEVYPGHDYGSKTSSTIGEEKRTNYTLKKRTLKEFIEFMREP